LDVSNIDSAEADSANALDSNGMKEAAFTARQTFRTSSFWLLAVYQGLLMFGVSSIGIHLIPFTVEELNLPLGTAGSLVTVMTVCIILGHVIGGPISDRLNKRMLLLALTAVQTLALPLLIFGNSLPMIMIFLVVQGLSVGIRTPLSFALRADFFGRKAYGTIWGVSLAIVNAGNMAGVVTTGYLADLFGGYQQAFFLLMGLTALSFVLLSLARRPELPEHEGKGVEGSELR
jgi:MFS family permease